MRKKTTNLFNKTFQLVGLKNPPPPLDLPVMSPESDAWSAQRLLESWDCHSDLTNRPGPIGPPKWWFSKGIPGLFQGNLGWIPRLFHTKSRLVKYYFIWPASFLRKKNWLTLRIMGSQNWLFGDPRPLLYTSKPLYRRVQWFLGQEKNGEPLPNFWVFFCSKSKVWNFDFMVWLSKKKT